MRSLALALLVACGKQTAPASSEVPAGVPTSGSPAGAATGTAAGAPTGTPGTTGWSPTRYRVAYGWFGVRGGAGAPVDDVDLFGSPVEWPIQLAVRLGDDTVEAALTPANHCDVVLTTTEVLPPAPWSAAAGTWIAVELPTGAAVTAANCADLDLADPWADAAARVAAHHWGLGITALDDADRAALGGTTGTTDTALGGRWWTDAAPGAIGGGVLQAPGVAFANQVDAAGLLARDPNHDMVPLDADAVLDASGTVVDALVQVIPLGPWRDASELYPPVTPFECPVPGPRAARAAAWGDGDHPCARTNWSDQLTSRPSVRYAGAMLTPLEKKSLAASVFERLREAIVAGEVPVGDALPAERVLAEQLGVNRQAVREGLKRLEQAGLVAIQQGGSTRVLDYRRTAGLELLAALIRTPTGIDTAVARSVIELRGALGPEVARAAARTRGGAHQGEIRARLADLRGTDDLGALQLAALEWWGAVVRGSGSLAYQLAYNSLDATYRQLMEPLARLVSDEVRAVDDYAAATDAIAAGDLDGAAAAARRIVARGNRATLDLLDRLDAAEEER